MEGGSIFIASYYSWKKSDMASGVQAFHFDSKRLMRDCFLTTLLCLCPCVRQNSTGIASQFKSFKAERGHITAGGGSMQMPTFRLLSLLLPE